MCTPLLIQDLEYKVGALMDISDRYFGSIDITCTNVILSKSNLSEKKQQKKEILKSLN